MPGKTTMLRMIFFDNGGKLLRLLLLLLLAYLVLTLAAYHLPSPPVVTVETTFVDPSSPSLLSHTPLPFLGINTALEQYPLPARRAALARLHASGFGWVRQRLDWATLEPTPGAYDWRLSDALIHDIRAADLVPVIVLDGSPVWARAPQDQPPTDNPFAPPADFRDFARFAAAVATRYRDQLTFYEIWNEPNIAPHWGNRLIEPVGYAQLLKVTAQAIRAADPNATLISAALAPTRDRGHTAIDEVYYLQRLYAAGAAPYFDVLAIQPFGFDTAPADSRLGVDRLNFGRAQLLRQTMVTAGDGEKPIWAVRYGWNRHLASPWATVSEANQLRFATDALTVAQREWPWLTAIAWAVDQPDAPVDDPIWGFALTPAMGDAFGGWVQSEDGGHAGGGNRLKPVAARQNPLKRVREVFADWGIGWWLLVLGVGWRTVVVGGQLPWARWGMAYRSRPPWWRVIVWAILLLIYYFATWPGLILLCWLAAAILLRWQPEVGLWLAAVLLPFDGQHKEFVLGTLAFALAPSHAILLALALGSIKKIRLSNNPYPTSALHLSHRFARQMPQVAFFNRFTGASWGIPHLALGWLLLNLLNIYNVWQWPAYREGLWDLVLLPLLGFWLVRRFVHTMQQARHLVLALFLGGVAVAGIGLIGWWQGNGTAVDGLLRLVGPYFSPNQAALYLERTLFLGIGLLWVMAGYRRWIGVACGLVMLALLLTASRGALLLGLPAGGVLWAWGWWRAQAWSRGKGRAYRHTPPRNAGAHAPASDDRTGRWSVPGGIPRWSVERVFANLRAMAAGRVRPRWYLLVVLVLLILLVVLVFMPLLGDRLTNSATVLQRITIWRSALTLWRDFFWLGVGPGGFFWHYPAYLPLGALDEPNLYHPHNLWLELATGWGLLGLLWLGLLLWWLMGQLRWLLRANTPMDWRALALLAAFGAGLAHAQVDAFLVLPDLASWGWLALALLAQPPHVMGTSQNP